MSSLDYYRYSHYHLTKTLNSSCENRKLPVASFGLFVCLVDLVEEDDDDDDDEEEIPSRITLTEFNTRLNTIHIAVKQHVNI